MLELDGSTKLLKTVLSLVLQNKTFVKCPKCGKTLGLFEIYNQHCAHCGDTEFNEMVIMKGLLDDEK